MSSAPTVGEYGANDNPAVDLQNLKRLVALQTSYISQLEGKIKQPNETNQVSTQAHEASRMAGQRANDLGAYEAQLMLASLRSSASDDVDPGMLDASLTAFLSPHQPTRSHNATLNRQQNTQATGPMNGQKRPMVTESTRMPAADRHQHPHPGGGGRSTGRAVEHGRTGSHSTVGAGHRQHQRRNLSKGLSQHGRNENRGKAAGGGATGNANQQRKQQQQQLTRQNNSSHTAAQARKNAVATKGSSRGGQTEHFSRRRIDAGPHPHHGRATHSNDRDRGNNDGDQVYEDSDSVEPPSCDEDEFDRVGTGIEVASYETEAALGRWQNGNPNPHSAAASQTSKPGDLMERLRAQAMAHESEVRALRESKNKALEELHHHWKQVADKRKLAHAKVCSSSLYAHFARRLSYAKRWSAVSFTLACQPFYRPLTKLLPNTEPRWKKWNACFEVRCTFNLMHVHP